MMKVKNLFPAVVLFLFSLCNSSPVRAIEPKEGNSIRIMSYNVRNCTGMDNVTDFQRVADVINSVAPDVVAVQELDSATERSKGVFVLEELAKRTLMYHSYGPAIHFQGGKYGIGILSKEKPIGSKTFPLPGREEKRALLMVEFDGYYVCCTHFSLTDEDKDLSVSIISDIVKNITKPLFLAGDMNSLYDSPTQAALRGNFLTLNNYRQNTFPSDGANICIDFIYGYRNGNMYSVLAKKVIDEKLASDHLPLFVDVRLAAKKEDIFRTKPYLQNPVGNGITVSWLTNVAVQSWVEYGLNGKPDQRKENYVDGQMICNDKHHKIRLTDLQPGATYSYRVCSREITLYEAYKKEFGETACSEVYTFTVPSPTDNDFTAVIFNDLHKRKDIVDMFARQLEAIDYDFVFFNGDCVDDPKNEKEAVSFLSYMNEKVGAEKVPVFYTRGNHEIRNAYSIKLRELFDYVGDKPYGAFNWGDTRIVVLDCGEDKPDTTWVYYGLNDFDGFRKDQVDFLKKELNSKDFKKAAKKVLIHHIPVYGMREGGFNPCFDLWNGLLYKAPFDICLNGHTHRFTYHPKGTAGNNFPVVIGGGNRPEGATMMVLRKKGNRMNLQVLDVNGNEKLKLDL
jgi:endonuclease/exonuclease/phosphatase family metal-dependent hydrolase/predicted phosphodiesterase